MMRAALIAAVLLAAACAPRPEIEHDGLRFEERQAQLSTISSWRMQGRLAIDTGERAAQGRFNWVQDDDLSTLLVRGPLGGGAFEITGGADGMVVTTRGERHELEDPEIELSALLGWWMPVESLDTWLLGLPDPRYPAQTRLGRAETLAQLEQRRWRVDYEGYQLIAGILIPRRLRMTHGTLDVRVTIDVWSGRSLNSTPLEPHNTALKAIDHSWGVAKR